MAYFAYGSNLFTPWLRSRAPSATAMGVARLSGFQLRWHKRSDLDGSGKCDAWRTSDPDHEIWGVVYDMDPEEIALLDKVESVDHGYLKQTAQLEMESKAVSVFYYVSEPKSVDPLLRPFTWYRSLVLAGARNHKLPESYLTEIRRQPAVVDPDSARAAQALTLLGGAGGAR